MVKLIRFLFGSPARVLALLMTGVIAVSIYAPRSTRTPTPNTPEIAPKKDDGPLWDKSPETQAARAQIIQDMIDKGYIAKIDFDGPRDPSAEVWIEPKFLAATYDEKKGIAQGIYDYYFTGREDFAIVSFIDNYDGKRIGKFTMKGGLSWGK